MAMLPRSGLAGLVRFWLDKLPALSVQGLVVMMPLTALVALGLGWTAAQTPDALMRGIVFGAGIVLVASTFSFGLAILANNVKAVASLFVTRFGKTDLRHAQALVTALMLSPEPVEFYVLGGELVKRVPRKRQGVEESAAEESAMEELFRITQHGPATLLIDLESACLVEKEGAYRVEHAPRVMLNAQERLLGCVSLRPQWQVLDVGVLTRDLIPLTVKGNVEYQIHQDLHHFTMTASRFGYELAVKRALLPQNEWRSKTRQQIQKTVSGIGLEYDLAELYSGSAKPSVPEAMVTLGAVAKGLTPMAVRLAWQKRILALLNEECWRWGVVVTQVEVAELTPSVEVVKGAERQFLAWGEMRSQVQQTKLLAESKSVVALMEAEADKHKEYLRAEGEADAYSKRLRARAEGAQEFMRSIEGIKQTLGPTVDRAIMQELLLALGFVSPKRRQGEPLGKIEMFARGPLPDREEWE